MIRSMTVENFRGFERFELHDLGRVNLLVGTNNSGKTSILEAVDLLTANCEISVLHRLHFRRSELIVNRHEDNSRDQRLLDIRRLFRGHSLTNSKAFRIAAITDDLPLTLNVEVIHSPASQIKANGFPSVNGIQVEGSPTSRVLFDWGIEGSRVEADLGPFSAVPLDSFRLVGIHPSELVRRGAVHFLSTTSLSTMELVGLFSTVQLRPQEQFVYQALNLIDPGIQRIAIQLESHGNISVLATRGGFLILHRDFPEPIPIGSLGEGIWRLLALALSLSQSANGILLIDDIDSGLHYSVMEQMWKLVTETAKKLNIQVFATTHSRDCYESLAAVCRDSETDTHEVTIQRIEARKKRSVAYSEQEIIQAAKHGTEVR